MVHNYDRVFKEIMISGSNKYVFHAGLIFIAGF